MGALQQLRFFVQVLAAGLLVTACGMAQIQVDGLPSEDVVLTGTAQYRNVNVTSAAPFSFSLTEHEMPGIAWVQVCVAGSCSQSGNASGNVTLNIRLVNDLGSHAGPFTATVNLTDGTNSAELDITFVPGPGYGMTATPVYPSNLAVSVPSGGSATSTLVLQNQSGTAVTVGSLMAITGDGGNWLSASIASATVAAGTSDLITVTTNAAGLPDGQYSGQIQMVVTPGNAILIPVSLNAGQSGIAVSSGSLAIPFANGISQAQQLSISGVSGYGATAVTTSGGDWLVLSAAGAAGTQVTSVPQMQPLTAIVGTAAASLQTGIYQGSINLSGSDGSQASVVVTLLVNTTAPAAIVANPANLNFSWQTGSAAPPPQMLVISAPAGALFTITSDSQWLSPGVAQEVAPADVPIYIAPGFLQVGSYTGKLTITSGTLTQTVAVNLVVADHPVVWGSYPVSGGTTGTALFSSSGSTATPASQLVYLTTSDSSTAFYALSSFPNWMTVTLTGSQITIRPNVSGLGAGVYSGSVVVNTSNADNTLGVTSVSIPVVLVANGGGSGTGSLALSQATLTFLGTIGATPQPQSLTVTAPSATLFSATAAGSWLSISPSGNNLVTPQPLQVSVNAAGLSPGTYSGAILLTANGVTQTVPVTFQLSPGGGVIGSALITDQPSLTFTATAGVTPPSQMLTVSNAVSGTAPTSFTVSTSPAWLKADATQGTTQKVLNISVDPAGLAANTYTGTITITPAGGSPVAVGVTFTVQPQPLISLDTTGISFSYRPGDALPAARTLSVTGSGGFTSSAATDSGWLSVSPLAGIAGTDIITISVNPANLGPGLYTGTVTVTGTNGLTGQAVITVTLTVLPLLPTITTVGNAASYSQGPVAPGEFITMKGSGLGPAGQTFTAQLDATGKLATILGGVQVLVNGFAAPMVYVSPAQVSAIVPYEVARSANAVIAVKYLGQVSNGVTLPVAATAPGIFTQDSSGSGPAGFNGDFTVNSAANPAPRSGYVTLFVTGEGQTAPVGVSGTINPNSGNLPAPLASISILIDGQPAAYSYAGGVPGTAEGILQLNVQIPATARSGADPVLVLIGSNSSQSGVTVAVQ